MRILAHICADSYCAVLNFGMVVVVVVVVVAQKNVWLEKVTSRFFDPCWIFICVFNNFTYSTVVCLPILENSPASASSLQLAPWLHR
jgi:hypothetical protein